LGSGIAEATLVVYDPDANMVEFTQTITPQSIGGMLNLNNDGTYTAVATVIDNVGNASVETITFDCYELPPPPPDPLVIEFAPYGHNNWWGPEYVEPFVFTVIGDVGMNGIVASFWGMPAGDLLQGPQIVGSSAGTYQIYFTADIQEGYDNLKLVVEGTNIDGEMTSNNAIYGIDMDAPVIMVNTPTVDQQFDIDGESVSVNIRAYVYDDKSGVSMVDLKVDDVMVQAAYENGVISYRGDFGLGEHTVEVIAEDYVLNASSLQWNFYVIDVNVPIVIEEAHVYPNPVNFEEGECMTFSVDTSKASAITVVIYDFAGNEVTKLSSNGRDALVWDGRTTKGIRVARGVYFAKVSAHDGKNVVDKIIKIAIKG
jgi:hypothetical protein